MALVKRGHFPLELLNYSCYNNLKGVGAMRDVLRKLFIILGILVAAGEIIWMLTCINSDINIFSFFGNAFLFFAIAVALLMIGANIKPSAATPKRVAREFSRNGYTVTDYIHSLYIDSNNKKWAVATNKGINYFFGFEDITDYALIEDGNRLTQQGGIARSLAGGVLLGGTGAIIGAITAPTKAVINQMYIDIFTNNAACSISRIYLINSETKTNSLLYQNAKTIAQTILSKIAYMCANAPVTEKAQQNKEKNKSPISADIAEEIRKFKLLLDEGAISEEEYVNIKEQLLSNINKPNEQNEKIFAQENSTPREQEESVNDMPEIGLWSGPYNK